MKKKYKHITIIIFIMVFISIINCSRDNTENYKQEIKNGIVYHYNYGENDTTFALEFDSLLTINLDQDSLNLKFHDFVIDKNESIYLTEYNSRSIYKYNSDGRFERSFGSKGMGPGEFNDIMFTYIIDDTLYAAENTRRLISRFNLSGKFINSYSRNDEWIGKIKMLNDSIMICRYTKWDITDSKANLVTSISTFNNKIQKLNDCYVNLLDYKKEPHKIPLVRNHFCGMKDEVYEGIKSINKYQLRKFNLKGDLQSVVNLSYRRQKYSEADYKEIYPERPNDIHFNNYLKEINQCKFAFKEIYSVLDKYIFALRYETIHCDYVLFDVFEEGKFLKTIKFYLPNIKEQEKINSYELSFKFNNNKLYVMDHAAEVLVVYGIK
ncbi:MAG: 6-bladed beta-propeller [Candidatus Delongbacteria bacterium]|jgi:hypothetical protein|nr:6-bladed beta-propeller [Candidatus Delongbacteria bacterium]